MHVGVRHKLVSVGGPGAAATLPLVLALLFSVHSFIAGLALGIQSQLGSSAIAILIAILGHKLVEALSLASSFVKEGVTFRTSLSVLLTYSCMTPLGVAVGAAVVRLGHRWTLLEADVSGFAAGSFVFLAARELTSASPASSFGGPRLRAALALAGMGCMAVLSLWV